MVGLINAFPQEGCFLELCLPLILPIPVASAKDPSVRCPNKKDTSETNQDNL